MSTPANLMNTELKPEIRYVLTSRNPADISRRGATINELLKSWRNGLNSFAHERNQ